MFPFDLMESSPPPSPQPPPPPLLTMVATAHHGVINSGSKKAVLAILLSFSSFFLLFAVLSLPWTTVLLSRGGWKKGWWLSGQSTSNSFSSVRGKRRSSDTPMRSLMVEEDKIGEGEESERPWSPPPLVNSRSLRRIPIPPGIPVHSRNIPWLNLSVLQVRTREHSSGSIWFSDSLHSFLVAFRSSPIFPS